MCDTLLGSPLYRLQDFQRTITDARSKRIPFHELAAYLKKSQPQGRVTLEGNDVILTGQQGDLELTLHFTFLQQITTEDGDRYDNIRMHGTWNLIYLSTLYSSEEG